MATICKACSHPKRLEIEKALLDGGSCRKLEGRYRIPKSTLDRHRREHIPASLARNARAAEVLSAATVEHEARVADIVRADALLDDVRLGEGRAERLYANAESILKAALEEKDRRSALAAIRAAVDVMGEAREYMQLRGRITGELTKEPSVRIDVSVPSPFLQSLDDEKLAQIEAWMERAQVHQPRTLEAVAEVVTG